MSDKVFSMVAGVPSTYASLLSALLHKEAVTSRTASLRRQHAAKQLRPRLEELEPILVPAVIFSESFEGAFPGGNWGVNTSQGRTWDDVNYKARSGSWSGFGSFLNTSDHKYVNNMSTYMERTVSLAGYTSPVLSFYDWLNTEAGYDFLRVKINGSQVWSDSGKKQSWNSQSINLSAYAGQSSVTVRFEFSSDSSIVPTGDSGAYLDDITLTATPVVQLADLQGYWCDVQNTAAQWGQTISVPQVQVQNAGPGAAGAFQLQWYLSRDQLGSNDDILLTQANGASSYSHAGIAAGGFGPNFSVTLRLPSALPGGWSGTSFYVVMKSDSANQV